MTSQSQGLPFDSALQNSILLIEFVVPCPAILFQRRVS